MRAILTKYAVTLGVSVVSAISFTLPAQAFDFKVSGQVDRALIAADNGENSDIGFVDNVGSVSRFRFTGDQGKKADLIQLT